MKMLESRSQKVDTETKFYVEMCECNFGEYGPKEKE